MSEELAGSPTHHPCFQLIGQNYSTATLTRMGSPRGVSLPHEWARSVRKEVPHPQGQTEGTCFAGPGAEPCSLGWGWVLPRRAAGPVLVSGVAPAATSLPRPGLLSWLLALPGGLEGVWQV